MENVQATATEPPLATLMQASFPVQAFSFDSARYWGFIEALVDGLSAYEAMIQKGSCDHASTPLPAA